MALRATAARLCATQGQDLPNRTDLQFRATFTVVLCRTLRVIFLGSLEREVITMICYLCGGAIVGMLFPTTDLNLVPPSVLLLNARIVILLRLHQVPQAYFMAVMVNAILTITQSQEQMGTLEARSVWTAESFAGMHWLPYSCGQLIASLVHLVLLPTCFFITFAE